MTLTNWQLRNPANLVVEVCPSEGVIVTDDFSTVYGFSETVDEAIRDYTVSLAEYCDFIFGLKSETPALAKVRRRLLRHVMCA